MHSYSRNMSGCHSHKHNITLLSSTEAVALHLPNFAHIFMRIDLENMHMNKAHSRITTKSRMPRLDILLRNPKKNRNVIT